MQSPKTKRRKIRWPTTRFLKKKAWRLISHPIFLVLTVFGNLLIISGAFGLYAVEMGINPHIKSMLDTLWWAVATVTTVGYGDIIPITNMGKIIGIILMIFGTALFWSYTALFADALISEELDDFESDLKSMETKLRMYKKEQEKHSSVDLLERIEKHLAALRETPPPLADTKKGTRE